MHQIVRLALIATAVVTTASLAVVLDVKLSAREKSDLVAFMRAL